MTPSWLHNYRVAMIRLRQTYEAVREVSASSQDGTAKVILLASFEHARDELRKFAKYQFGVTNEELKDLRLYERRMAKHAKRCGLPEDDWED